MSNSEFSRKSVLAAIGCWVGFLLGPNVMIAASNANFLDALKDEFGSVSAVSTPLAIAPLVVAICVPLAGHWMDRRGPRAVILPGIILFGLSFFLLSRIGVIWQFAVLQVLLSIAAAMNSSVGYAKVISSWFDKHRGFVLGGCVAFGAGLGQISMPKISQWLIDDFGWRGGYTGMSIIILFVGLPLVFALARPNPATVGASSVGHPEGEKTAEGLTVPEALRTFSYYKVFFAIMFASMTLIGTLSHSRIMLEEHGFSANLATTAASISFAGVLLGELSAGLLLDRFQSPRAVLPYFLSALVGVLIFHTASGSVPILLGGALLMGMGLGGEVGMNAYLVSRYCGLKSFATLYGGTFAASNLGIAIGIFTMGKVHDSAGSYDPMVYVFGTTMLISVLSIASLGPFVYKAKSSH